MYDCPHFLFLDVIMIKSVSFSSVVTCVENTKLIDRWKGNEASYGFAAELRPFVGKGCSVLDGCFGKALKSGSRVGSHLYYEGLYWMVKSGNLSVKVAEDGNMENFIRHYIQVVDRTSLCYREDGFFYVGSSVVLVPSQEQWDAFVKEKITNIRITSEDSYLFGGEILKKVQQIVKKHGIVTFYTTSISRFCDRKSSDVFSICRDNYEDLIGRISIHNKKGCPSRIKIQGVKFGVKEEVFVEGLEKKELKTVMTFIKDVLARSGSFYSAHAWLKQMKKV